MAKKLLHIPTGLIIKEERTDFCGRQITPHNKFYYTIIKELFNLQVINEYDCSYITDSHRVVICTLIDQQILPRQIRIFTAYIKYMQKTMSLNEFEVIDV